MRISYGLMYVRYVLYVMCNVCMTGMYGVSVYMVRMVCICRKYGKFVMSVMYDLNVSTIFWV